MLLVFAAHGLIVPFTGAPVIATVSPDERRNGNRHGSSRCPPAPHDAQPGGNGGSNSAHTVRTRPPHPTRDLDFGLAGVVARILTTAPRVDRDAAGLVG